MTTFKKLRVSIQEDREYGDIFFVSNDPTAIAGALTAIMAANGSTPKTVREVELEAEVAAAETSKESSNSSYYKELTAKRLVEKELKELKEKLSDMTQVGGSD